MMKVRPVLTMAFALLSGVYFLFGGDGRQKGPLLAFQENVIRTGKESGGADSATPKRPSTPTPAPRPQAWYMKDADSPAGEIELADVELGEGGGESGGILANSYDDPAGASARPILAFAGPAILAEQPQLKEGLSGWSGI